MATIISLLRGINVSGKKSIKMEALRKTYESIGLSDVVSYIQSGNIVFSTEHSDLDRLEESISEQIKQDFGFDVAIFLLNIEQLEDIIKNCPFKGEAEKAPSSLYITYLKSKPNLHVTDAINNKKHEEEKICLVNNVVYLFCPNGYGKTKLNNTLFEKEFKTEATTRNWNMLNKLLSIATKTKKDKS